MSLGTESVANAVNPFGMNDMLDDLKSFCREHFTIEQVNEIVSETEKAYKIKKEKKKKNDFGLMIHNYG